MIGAGGPLALTDLGFAYGTRRVLEEISLTLGAGELVFVIGRNGSGKSTLLRLAAGLLRPDRGTARLGGIDLARWSRRDLARHVAYVPQRTAIDFPFTALEVVLQGRHPYVGLLRGETTADLDIALACLEELGVAELAGRAVTTLSGGELQLVQVAAALAQTPAVLLLDEPTSSLDPAHVRLLFARLRARAACGLAVLIVAHDLNQAGAYADSVTALAGGRMVASGAPGAVLATEPLERIYGVRLETVPSPISGRPQVLLEERP